MKVNPTPKDLPKNTIFFWSGDCLDVMSCAASLWRVRHVCWHLEIDEVAASNHWTQKVGKNDVRKNQNKSDLNLSLQNMDWIQIHYNTHRRSNANFLVHRSPKKCLSVDTASTWAFFVAVLFGTGSWRLMIGCSRGPCCWIFYWERWSTVCYQNVRYESVWFLETTRVWDISCAILCTLHQPKILLYIPPPRTCPLVMGLDGLRWAAKRGLVKVRTPDLFSRTWISSEKLKISMVCFLCESVFWRCVSVIHDEKNGAPKRER